MYRQLLACACPKSWQIRPIREHCVKCRLYIHVWIYLPAHVTRYMPGSEQFIAHWLNCLQIKWICHQNNSIPVPNNRDLIPNNSNCHLPYEFIQGTQTPQRYTLKKGFHVVVYNILHSRRFEDVPFVEFMYFDFTRIPDGSYRSSRIRSHRIRVTSVRRY